MRRKILFSCQFLPPFAYGGNFVWIASAPIWFSLDLLGHLLFSSGLPPTTPPPRLRYHPANFLHEEGRGLFTAPPKHNWSELHASLFLRFSEVQCLDPIPPLQTSHVVLFALSSGLAQAEAESGCEWCSSVPQLLRTSEELRVHGSCNTSCSRVDFHFEFKTFMCEFYIFKAPFGA